MEGLRPCEAQRKFWGCPELVDMVLPFLDSNSILSLCQALPAVVKVVQGKTAWNKLIRRTCNFDFNSTDYVSLNPVKEANVEKHVKVASLAGMLTKMADPAESLLDLLDLICEKHPSYERDGRKDFIELSCPRHVGNHSVSPAGFMLLEEVESVI